LNCLTIRVIKCLALCLCLTFSCHAFSAAEAPTCLELLTPVIASLTKEPNPIIHAGPVESFPKLLIEAGFSPLFINATVMMIDEALNSSENPRSLISQLRDRLQTADNEERLLVCILGNCQMTTPAMHVAVQTPFSIAPFHDVVGKTKKLGWYKDRSTVPVGFYRAIVIGRSRNETPVYYTSNFIHEAMHFADFDLINDWINASLTLVQNHQQTDELFRLHVQIRNSVPVIDEAFLRVFLESRAYNVESMIFKKQLGPIRYKTTRIILSREAMKDYSDFDPITAPIVAQYSITSANVFDLGERFGRTMLDTIDHAKKF
jgi:hypothetical protein